MIRKLVEAQRAMILRANTYLAIDVAREEADPAYRQGKEEHRVALRRHGFHLVLKEARRPGYARSHDQELPESE